MEMAIARGHAGLKMSYGAVLPEIGPEGARIHEIARSQCVSRQAIFATARELEALGYVHRSPDPRDRRGNALRLTERGAAADRRLGRRDRCARGIRSARSSAARRFAHVERVARDLYDALGLGASMPAASAALDIEQLAAQAARPARRGRRGARSPHSSDFANGDTP
jgi:DNA-binding MarR family transcriptional regulator